MQILEKGREDVSNNWKMAQTGSSLLEEGNAQHPSLVECHIPVKMNHKIFVPSVKLFDQRYEKRTDPAKTLAGTKNLETFNEKLY